MRVSWKNMDEEVKRLDRNLKTKKYKISIIIDTSVKQFDTEYSIDCYNYQNSSEFSNVSPGNHTFYARNKTDKSLVDSMMYLLPEIKPQPSPPDDVLNDLLRKMANGDQKAKKKWRETVEEGLTIPTSGAANISNSYELSVDALQGNHYSVKAQRDSEGKIIKIIVK